MRTLIIYFSLEGHSERIANIIKDEFNADIEKVALKKPLPKGFLKYLVGVMMTVLGKKPEIFPLKNNPENYDLIIFCSPIWASNVAAPLNTVVSDYRIENKKIGIFCSSGGIEHNTLSKFKSKLPSTNKIIVEKIFFEKELEGERGIQRVKNLLKDIK